MLGSLAWMVLTYTFLAFFSNESTAGIRLKGKPR